MGEQTRGGARALPIPAGVGESPRGALRSGARLRVAEDPFEGSPCASFEEVYWLHKAFILQEIRRRLRSGTSKSLVDDIFQEVCVRLHRSLGGAPGAVPNPSRELLERLVANQVRSQTRAAARRRIDGEPDEDTPPISRSNPELLVSRAEDAAQARELFTAIFDKLEPDAKDVLSLVDIEEMSHKEAAAMLGCSEVALAGRLYRARHKFEELGQQLALLLHKQRRTG